MFCLDCGVNVCGQERITVMNNNAVQDRSSSGLLCTHRKNAKHQSLQRGRGLNDHEDTSEDRLASAKLTEALNAYMTSQNYVHIAGMIGHEESN
eukprot:79620-Amphidinium_carterae.2